MKLLFVFSQLTKRTFLLALATLCAACAHAQVIATNDLHLGYIQQSYVGQMTATGGTGPYTWSVSGGALPSGISLSSGGALGGTPSAGGTFSVTIQVTDHLGSTATKIFSLQVFEQPTDKYGGLINKTCTNGPRAHFYTQKMGGRWYLCTPAGNVFWMNGIFAVGQDNGTDYQGIRTSTLTNAKYATGFSSNSTLNWALSVVRREQSWGFNANAVTLNLYVQPNTVHPSWPTSDHTIPVKLPYVVFVSASNYASVDLYGYSAARGHGPIKTTTGAFKFSVTPGIGITSGADFFDPGFAAWLAGDLAAPNGNDYKYQFSGNNIDYLVGIIGDEGDNIGGLRQGVDFPTIVQATYQSKGADAHWGWMTLAASPVVTAEACTSTIKGYGCTTPGHDLLFADTEHYSKVEVGTWVHQAADSGPNYANISALNTAWGSHYDSFGSDAVAHNGEACATGNGTTGPYTCTLSVHPLTPLTVQVLVGGTLTAGDDGAGPRAATVTATGCFRGATSKAASSGGTAPCYGIAGTNFLGTINYTTGAVSLTFKNPVDVGTAITLNYQTNGWGTGHGLLDEDGTCPAKVSTCWIPADYYLSPATHNSPPAGTTSAIITDMDNFLYHLAKNYASVEKSAFATAVPGVLYFGPPLGGWSTPSRASVYKGFSAYLDVLYLQTIPAPNPVGAITDNQARVDFVSTNVGDVPIFNWEGFFAQSDSYMSPYTSGESYSYATQALRGAGLQTSINALFNTQISTGPQAGTFPMVGYAWWTYYDMRSVSQNLGIVTPRDDPYDGVSSTTTQGYDSWGYPTGCVPTFGCEQGNYGDFIGPATTANLNALRATAGGTTGPLMTLQAAPH
jgi:hypothetical protein